MSYYLFFASFFPLWKVVRIIIHLLLQQYVTFNVLKEYCISKEEDMSRSSPSCLLKSGPSSFKVVRVVIFRYSKPITPLENRICEKCFSDEIESEERLLLNVLFTILPGASFLKQLRITLIILPLKNCHLGINLYGF